MTTLTLAATIAAATWLAFWLDKNVAWCSKIGASLLALIFGATLSNTGVVPATSVVYDVVAGPVTSLAIAWLLLSVNLADLRIAGRKMLSAFGLALLGTAAGACVASVLLATSFGDNAWRLGGTLTGTYSGGSVNFVSVGRALDLPEQLFVGANAADALTTGLWLAVTLTAPLWLGRMFGKREGGAARADSRAHTDPREHAEQGGQTDSREQTNPATPTDPAARSGSASPPAPEHPFFSRVGLSSLDVGVLIALGLILLAVADWLGSLVPAVPSILWLTTLALVVGHTRTFRSAPGAMQLGNLALHFFFIVIGIWSRVADIMAVGIQVFFFTLTVVGIHGVVVYGLGRLAKLDVETLSVASQAAIGGPSSALAVAVAKEWHHLVLPGVIVGLLGYAIGNYLGLAVAALARVLIGA